ncbi:UNVERIFIED_CONTAM: hypothetical protein K2H54_058077 [Gekko kuhli]
MCDFWILSGLRLKVVNKTLQKHAMPTSCPHRSTQVYEAMFQRLKCKVGFFQASALIGRSGARDRKNDAMQQMRHIKYIKEKSKRGGPSYATYRLISLSHHTEREKCFLVSARYLAK